MIFLKNYFVNTTSGVDVISVIHEINRTIKDSNIPEGLATVVIPQPGGAVTIIEMLPELVEQLKLAVKVFPGEGTETKNRRKEEIALGPRVVAAMLGKSLQIPVSGGKLVLDPREEVVLVDLETKALRREFYVQIMGEAPKQPEQRGAPARRR